MNYNSINEILSSGITNMTVLRNNSKQDDGVDTITGVSWFTYNGTVVNKVYASGNSFIGFGASSEHLKVNRIDGALYSLYREEGTLYDHYKFLKIRWKGYSYYSSTSSSYLLEYDVILWDTGDISLHMINIPTSNNGGTYTLMADKTYNYNVSTSKMDITFKKTDSGFEVVNSIIELALPYNKRYLIRSGSNYYTIKNNTLSKLEVTNLTANIFLNKGIINKLPTITSSLISNLANPEILYWNDGNVSLENGLIISGTPPLPQIVYCDSQDISNYSGIEKILTSSSNDVLFTISFDND
jgi:hypothetical protein